MISNNHVFVNMQQHISPIISKQYLADDILELHFKKPSDFVYQAGQYVQITIPDDSAIVRRSYSLITAPHQDHLGFCIKVVPDGVGSTFLADLSVGSELQFRGPIGHFIADTTTDKHFFIATGVGISPILGILTQILLDNPLAHIYLLFGVRFDKDIIYHQLLDDLQKTYDNFSYHFTLSKSSEHWKGLTGRVTDHLTSDTSDHMQYICGSKEMVIETRKKLLELGVSSNNIKFEIF